MYLFRCGQGCSIDRPPFAKKPRERIVLTQTRPPPMVDTTQRNKYRKYSSFLGPISRPVLANNFAKELVIRGYHAFLESGVNGIKGVVKVDGSLLSRSKIAIITFDPIPINSLAKGKTRPINGTNGSVNGETMVEY